MPHVLDTWSVIVAINVARLTLTLAVAYCTRMTKTYSGFHHWVTGVGVGVLGFFSLALYRVVPTTSVILANGLNALYVLLLLDGTRRFVLGKPVDRRWYALPVFSGLVGGLFYFGFESVLARVWWNALLLGGMSALGGTIWLRRPADAARGLYRAAAVLSFAYPTLLVARALGITLSGRTAVHSLLQPGSKESLFFLAIGMLDFCMLTLYLTVNSERQEAELRESRAEIKMLSGILPICASCKKIRDGQDHWVQVETYVREHTDAQFSHGFCPECLKALYPAHLQDPDRSP